MDELSTSRSDEIRRPTARMLARRSNWARRPAGRINPGPSREAGTQRRSTREEIPCPSATISPIPAPTVAAKRQQPDSDREEKPEPKAMRRMSPMPMEEDTPPRPKTPNSNASSDFLDPVALLLPDSPQYGEQVLASDWPRGRETEQDAPWNVEGINQMTRLAELARRLPEVAYRRIGQLGPNHQDFVHMVMPLDDVRVATSSGMVSPTTTGFLPDAREYPAGLEGHA